jgi:hypothetical protein
MGLRLVGTWRLKVLEAHTADGVSLPYGPDAVGYLAYTPDGYMFVTMMRPGRVALGTQSWFEWTPEQKERVATDFMMYCGRYEERDGQIVHHIEQSLLPDWVGTSKVRYATLDGDQLTLTTEPPGAGPTGMTRVVFERATSIQRS